MQNELKEREKIAFIINPVSGAGKNLQLDDTIKKVIDNDIFEVIIERTRHKGHANILAKEFIESGIKKIVAVGGDGTINEIASALVNTKAALGIVPSGSGNGLARYLGIPLNSVQAINLLNNHKVKKIDAGQVNNKYFFCTCGTGFDARVGEKFDKRKKRGFINYIKTAIREFFTYNPKKYTIKIDGEKYIERAFLITLANAGQYGNNAYISPNASIDDGLLDICIIKPFPKHKVFSLGFRLFNRTIDKSKFIRVINGKKIKIKGKKKIHIHVDGEPVRPKKEIKIKVLPKALRVMVGIKI